MISYLINSLHMCKKIILYVPLNLFAAYFQSSDEDKSCRKLDGTSFIMCTIDINNKNRTCEGPLKKVM
jgi:hypothetical protein